MTADSSCRQCGHARPLHVRGKGCDVGWQYDDAGTPTVTGCVCTTTFPPPLCFTCRQVGSEHCPRHRHADPATSPTGVAP